MNPDMRRALVAVARRFAEHSVPFLLGGSGMLFALGLVEEVNDLDLEFRVGDRAAVRAAAGEWWRDSDREESPLWATAWFAELDVDGVAADAIGGMAFRHEHGVARLPFRSGGRWRVDGAEVALADPALWWAVYRAYKPDKAALLEQVVDAEARRAALVELGLQ